MTCRILQILILVLTTLLPALLFAQASQSASIYVEAGQQIETLDVSPDGRFIVTSDTGEDTRLWDMKSGKELWKFKGARAIFSPTRSEILTEWGTLGITLWDLSTGAEIKKFKVHTNTIVGMAFFPDGKRFVSTSRDGTIRLWDLASEASNSKLVLKAAAGWFDCIDVAPNGQLFAAGSTDGKIVVWNGSGEVVSEMNAPEGIGSITSIAFSPDSRSIVLARGYKFVSVWDVKLKNKLYEFSSGHQVTWAAFSPDGRSVAYDDAHSQSMWIRELTAGSQIELEGHKSWVETGTFLANELIVTGSNDGTIRFWDTRSKSEVRRIERHSEEISHTVALSPNGRHLLNDLGSGRLTVWDLQTSEFRNYAGESGKFYPDSTKLFTADGGKQGNINLWDLANGAGLGEVSAHTRSITRLSIGQKHLISSSKDKTVRVADRTDLKEIFRFSQHTSGVVFAIISWDNKMVGSLDDNNEILVWDPETGKIFHKFHHPDAILPFSGMADHADSLRFSPDGKYLISKSNQKIVLWDLATGRNVEQRDIGDILKLDHNILKLVIQMDDSKRQFTVKSADERFVFKRTSGQELGVYDVKSYQWSSDANVPLLSMIKFGETDWIVSSPDGRFDTNMSLDNIQGLHWIVNNEILNPLSLDVFMRQYYEPGLLPRTLKCNEQRDPDGSDSCDQEFKPLPSIAEINRVQPKVAIKEIKPVGNGLTDVTVEVESVSEEVGVSASDRSAKKRLTSGVYDLRLFRDGQLVGSSASKESLEGYIKAAPKAVEMDKASKALINTKEDEAWRQANLLINADQSKGVAAKTTFTFRKVKLLKDGRGDIEFSAYAFNADRVKSDTARATYKVEKPEKREGNTYLVTIGVNASETESFNLKYAANDAIEMQKVLGERIEATVKGTGSKLIRVPLIADIQNGEAQLTATKPIIKGVFELLAGNRAAILPDILKQIPNESQILPIEPEDTLIITFSGHGYADRNGIFYLLPYDIGKDTTKLTTETLQKLISSDELSLWMRDVTAKEMIMIVDACHSSAAVQGDGFKPGPMASRGLGQLAYDKGMKILSATQANNVALELGSLKQGILTYALLQDGVVQGKADSSEPKDKVLTAKEWLSYGMTAVPQLYQDVMTGKREIVINGKSVNFTSLDATERDFFQLGKAKTTNVQQPSLFDFKRGKTEVNLLTLKGLP